MKSSKGRNGGGKRAGGVLLLALWGLLLLVSGLGVGLGLWLNQSRSLPSSEPVAITLPPPPEPQVAEAPAAAMPEDALAAANAAQADAAEILAEGPPPPPPAIPRSRRQEAEAPPEDSGAALEDTQSPEDSAEAAANSEPATSAEIPPAPPAAETAEPAETPGEGPGATATDGATEAPQDAPQDAPGDAPVDAPGDAAETAAPETETPRESAAETPDSPPAEEPEAAALPPLQQLPAWRRYARAPEEPDTPQPRVAVVLTGLGYSESASEAAVERLPGAIGLSFSPYARRSAEWTAIARLGGREVLLDLPMEPRDYPASDPGPQALMVADSAQQNLDRLNWVLQQAPGVIGVTAMLGSRFLGEREALEPVMAALAARGLMFLDNGARRDSLAGETAAALGVPHAAVSVALDSGQVSRAAIDSRLVELERIARDRGFAIARANPYPVTIDALQDWAATLQERGFTLVPVSALATPGDRLPPVVTPDAAGPNAAGLPPRAPARNGNAPVRDGGAEG